MAVGQRPGYTVREGQSPERTEQLSITPFQGLSLVGSHTQGVALGWLIAALQAANGTQPSLNCAVQVATPQEVRFGETPLRLRSGQAPPAGETPALPGTREPRALATGGWSVAGAAVPPHAKRLQ